jgi:hypothetical protein
MARDADGVTGKSSFDAQTIRRATITGFFVMVVTGFIFREVSVTASGWWCPLNIDGLSVTGLVIPVDLTVTIRI